MRVREHATFWDGGALGPYEQLSLASFVAAGLPVELYTYSDALAVPSGVTVRDAREVVDEHRMRTFPGNVTHFSNHFRYRLLGARTVVWFDADLILLDASRLPDSDHVFGLQQDGLVNTALLGLPTDSGAVRTLIERSDVPEGTRLRWGRLGPRLLTEVLDDAGLLGEALPVQHLYPLSEDRIWMAFEPTERAACDVALDGAAALHLWNQYLKKLGLKDRAPAEGSLLDELAQRFDVRFDLPPIVAGAARSASLEKFGSRAAPRSRLVRRLRRFIRGGAVGPVKWGRRSAGRRRMGS